MLLAPPSLLLASLPPEVFLPLIIIMTIIIIKTLEGKRLALVPPSPPGILLIGHLHLLGSLPHRSLHALSTKYGPLMSLRLGFTPTLIISSPEVAKEVLKTHDRTFASRPPSKAAKLLFNNALDLAFSPYSDYWRQLRKLSTVHLLSTKKVQSYKLVRVEEVAFMMGRISPGQVVNMSKLLNTFAVDAVTRIIARTNFRENGKDDMFSKLVREMNKALFAFYLEDLFPSFGWLDQVLDLSKSTINCGNKWDAALEEHAGRLKEEGAEMDFVDTLLSVLQKPNQTTDLLITKQQMKALLMDMFTAGTETAYVTLEWAMAELVRNPRALEKLRDEVRGVSKGKNRVIQDEEVGRMPYLRAVLKEVLRLHPAAPLLVPHQSTEDCVVSGYHIPKKTKVLINAWSIGRNPSQWEEADKFRPERFLNGGSRDFMDDDFKFIPFGAGRRICPGLNFAVCNMEIVLANLVHRFGWELPQGLTASDIDMTEIAGVVIMKKEPLHLVAKRPRAGCGSATCNLDNYFAKCLQISSK